MEVGVPLSLPPTHWMGCSLSTQLHVTPNAASTGSTHSLDGTGWDWMGSTHLCPLTGLGTHSVRTQLLLQPLVQPAANERGSERGAPSWRRRASPHWPAWPGGSVWAVPFAHPKPAQPSKRGSPWKKKPLNHFAITFQPCFGVLFNWQGHRWP